MVLQILLGIYTYGMDRMTLYDRTKTYLYVFYECLLLFNCMLLSQNIHTIPYIPFLYSTKYYRFLKKHLGILKPSVIALLWSATAVLLPHLLDTHTHTHTHQYHYGCLQMLGCYLAVYGTSNLADIKDVEEDRDDGLLTIPIVYTEKVTEFVAISSIVASVITLLIQVYLQQHHH